MKSLIITIFLSFIYHHANAIPTAWIGGNGDWNVSTNWDTGIVPKYNDRITIGAGVTVTISASTFAKGKTLLVTQGAELIIEDGAELKLKDAVLSNLGTSLDNHGIITINGLLVVKHNTGLGYSSIHNHNIMNVNSTGELRIFDFEGNAVEIMNSNASLTNKGIVHIYEGDTGILTSNGKFINRDSLSMNLMESALINHGTMRNFGTINITESSKGILNYSQFYNQFAGDIFMNGNDDIGIGNYGDPLNNANKKFINFGDIYMDDCSNYSMYHLNFENFINKPAGDIEITNSESGLLEYGICSSKNYGRLVFDNTNYAIQLSSNCSFHNYANANILMSSNSSYGIRMLDSTFFINYGALVSDDSYHAIELFDDASFFNQDSGLVDIESCAIGIYGLGAESFLSSSGTINIKYTTYGIYYLNEARATIGGEIYLIDNELGIAIIEDDVPFTITGFAEFNGNLQAMNLIGSLLLHNGEIRNYDKICGSNTGRFSNSGIFYDEYNGSHGALVSLKNSGVVTDYNETNSWDAYNLSYIIKPWYNVQEGVIVSNALNQVSQVYYNVVDIYTDETSLITAGTYDANLDEFIPNSDAIGLSTLYALMSDVVTGTSSYVEIPIDGVISLVTQNQLPTMQSLKQNAERDFAIFPNPSIADISLQIPKDITGNINVTIVNQLGQSIEQYTAEVEGGETIRLLNDHTLPIGSYIITVSNSKEIIYQEKIIRK